MGLREDRYHAIPVRRIALVPRKLGDGGCETGGYPHAPLAVLASATDAQLVRANLLLDKAAQDRHVVRGQVVPALTLSPTSSGAYW